MMRLILLLFVGMAVSGCASPEARRELEAKRRASIESVAISPVNLSEQQLAKVKELSPKSEIAWLRAGRKADGKIFVCHVVAGKTIFGTRSVALFAGTIEPDGPYQQSLARLWSKQAVMDECRSHGFNPPVTIRATYSVMRI